VIETTIDLNVVRNMLDGLPLYSAFESGPTRMMGGITEALEYARRWETKSATLVVVSDGDFETSPPIRAIPSSIADSIVIGVGDPLRPTLVSGHRSKQESAALRTVASQLRGIYHEGNSRHLPREVLNNLSMIRPRVSDALGLRELAFISIGAGSVMLTCIGPLLVLAGRRRDTLMAAPNGVASLKETNGGLAGTPALEVM
jgi:Ca-activated chloride channel family protein